MRRDARSRAFAAALRMLLPDHRGADAAGRRRAGCQRGSRRSDPRPVRGGGRTERLSTPKISPERQITEDSRGTSSPRTSGSRPSMARWRARPCRRRPRADQQKGMGPGREPWAPRGHGPRVRDGGASTRTVPQQYESDPGGSRSYCSCSTWQKLRPTRAMTSCPNFS